MKPLEIFNLPSFLFDTSYTGLESTILSVVKKILNKPKEALQSVEDTLDQFKYTGCYVHGTTGTALVGIAKSEGRIARSNVDLKINGARHDFAAGVYCFKGEFQRALSFAIDRCWPIFGEETQSFTAMQNPAVALFHKPRQFNRQQKNELIIVSAKNIHSTMNI